MQTPKTVRGTRGCSHTRASLGGTEDTITERSSASEPQQNQSPHHTTQVTGSVASDAVRHWFDGRGYEEATGESSVIVSAVTLQRCGSVQACTLPVHCSTHANSPIAESKFKAVIISGHIESAATALLALWKQTERRTECYLCHLCCRWEYHLSGMKATPATCTSWT